MAEQTWECHLCGSANTGKHWFCSNCKQFRLPQLGLKRHEFFLAIFVLSLLGARALFTGDPPIDEPVSTILAATSTRQVVLQNPTRTPTLIPTRTPTPTRKSTHPLIEQAMGWPVVLRDSFNNNSADWVPYFDGENRSGYWIQDFDSQYWRASIVIDGTYTLDVSRTNGLIIYLDYPSIEKKNGNFFVSLDAQLVTGDVVEDSYGIFFRCQDFGNSVCLPGRSSYYYFEITEDQMFKVAYHSGTSSGKVLIDWKTSRAINPNGWNEIGVIAQGNHYSFLINGEIVGEVTDGTLNGGISGIRVEMPSGARANYQFDNFVIREP